MTAKLSSRVMGVVSALALVGAACGGSSGASSGNSAGGPECQTPETPVLTLAAYSTPREAYGKIISAFQTKWKEEHNDQQIIFQESYGASTTQAQNVLWPSCIWWNRRRSDGGDTTSMSSTSAVSAMGLTKAKTGIHQRTNGGEGSTSWPRPVPRPPTHMTSATTGEQDYGGESHPADPSVTYPVCTGGRRVTRQSLPTT